LHITDGEIINKISEGKFSDLIPDIYLVPVSPTSLTQWMLMIFGSYKAAFGHNQISVDYLFYQKEQEIGKEEIRLNSSSLSSHHDITFIKETV